MPNTNPTPPETKIPNNAPETGKEKAAETNVEVRMDSELLVKQFNNEYKISVPHLVPLYVEVHNLTLDFKSIRFIHIPREHNKEADAMVNKILDTR